MNSQINSNQDVNNNDTFKQAMEVAAIGAVAVGAGFGIHAAGSALKKGGTKLKNTTKNIGGNIKNAVNKISSSNALNKENVAKTKSSNNLIKKAKTNKNNLGNIKSQNAGSINYVPGDYTKNSYSSQKYVPGDYTKGSYSSNSQKYVPGDGYTKNSYLSVGSQISDAFANGLQKDRQILQSLVQDYKNAQTATEQANIYDRIMSLISSIRSSGNNPNEKTMINNMINEFLSQIPNNFK